MASDLVTIPTTPEGVEENPWGVVLAALTRKAQNISLTSDEEDACEYAGTLMAAVQLVRAGMDPDVVQEMFEERDYTLRFRWTRETDEIEVIVDWDVEDDTDV